ncbi:MAG: cardiolipin synthase [Methanocorpusculum sp.]|uniref:cardiolipin synthase n=1 Tax=Methanocorpusculum sp. TaxID=2058474 RepID=UPI0027286BA0|nr:cardiolipin synthase [Methanocorpusculum sp.]MDO9522658.1 cardiolipin synthase [Methanocorpusculum sp.]
MIDLLSIIYDEFMWFLQLIIILLDIGACITVIFLERRSPQAALTWILVMFFLPFLGLVLYLFFGRHLYGSHIFSKKTKADLMLASQAEEQFRKITENALELTPNLSRFDSTIALLLSLDNAVLTRNNEITLYTDGEMKFEAFKEAILEAKHHIHLEYFIIRDDELGNLVVDLLTQKAAEGIEVRAIFDAAGTFSVKKEFFTQLKKAGGDVRIFFPLKISFLNTRLNFRNHRKILVVDGTTGFIGGFNIGDEYLGKGPMGYWRDTHVRLHGKAVAALQTRFIMDWNYAAQDAQISVEDWESPYYPKEGFRDVTGHSYIQIASSGPDSAEKAIYSGYMSLIGHAKESIYIQTPYFIPDDPMLTGLLLAARSGVDVRIMIPCKPDHPLVYWANHSYLGDLLAAGVRGYAYNDGFIHSKAGVFDGVATTIGTANWDIRSFKLNFETNAFIYDLEFGKKMNQIFLSELETNCTEITLEEYKERSLNVKIKEGISRLFSPIL